MTAAYVSAFERLSQLPAIFKGSDVTMLFDWSGPTAASYIAQWSKKGMIKPLGGRAGIYFNLVVQRDFDLEAGLRRAIPMATKMGVDALREAGWTTQVIARAEVAVPDDGPAYSIDGFDLQPRSSRWYEMTSGGVGDDRLGLRRLKPEWALADMIYRGKDHRFTTAWMIAPDDVDLDAAQEAPEMEQALKAFDLDWSDVEYEGYGQAFDELLEWRFQMTGHPTIDERLPVRPATSRQRG